MVWRVWRQMAIHSLADAVKCRYSHISIRDTAKCDCRTECSRVFPLDSIETHSHADYNCTNYWTWRWNQSQCFFYSPHSSLLVCRSAGFRNEVGNILLSHFLFACQPTCPCHSPSVKEDASCIYFLKLDDSQNWSSVRVGVHLQIIILLWKQCRLWNRW